MKLRNTMTAMGALVLAWPVAAHADWMGFIDASDQLMTDTYAFTGTLPDQVNGNENYYDGDFADFDGDGLTDRALGARYGLLMNTGEGLMTPFAGHTGYLLRGMPGASGWGEDGFQWTDVDGDGDYDNLSGGNGEPLTLQTNRGGRFSTTWQMSVSALNIVNTDVEGDGDVDLAVAHAFCFNSNCGGPVTFALLINDGSGNMTEESAARGVGLGSTDFIVGVASADVDGDGDYDLVIEHGGADQTEIAVNDGSGNYTLQPTPLPTASSGFGQGLNLGDIDDDGDLDIVMVSRNAGHPDVDWAIGINNGNGGFANESGSRWDTTGFTDNGSAGNAALFDLDHDGDLDWVALRTDSSELNLGTHALHVFLNDGGGNFTYDTDNSVEFTAVGSALGADTDITDIDGDGTLDVWVGIGGDRVRIMLNSHVDPDGERADAPRNLEVLTQAAGDVRLRWEAPPFAATSRYYKVYRSTSPALHDADKRLIKIVGQRYQDEAFFDPITRHTTTADLGDPDVTLDGPANAIEFVDTAAKAGVTYQYSVSHVGPENTEGRHGAEIFAAVPAAGAADNAGPDVDIVGPTDQDWWSYPRVVVHLADGGSGVDPDSVRVSFDADLGDPAAGGRAAGEDVSDLAYRLDPGVVVVALPPPLELPDATLVTLTVDVSDMDGNSSSAQRQFFVDPVAAELPTASFAASALSGEAPFPVDFDASASTDTDGKLLRWEWYFGDGTTGVGRTVSHTYLAGGTYDVTLFVRDNDGGVSIETQQVDVEGDPAPCTVGEIQDCYSGPGGTQDVGICEAGQQQCLPGEWGECIGEIPPQTEVCDDGIDNDCDGDTDDVDTDCGGTGDSADGTGDSGDASGTEGDGTAGAGDGSGSGCGCRSTPAPTWLLLLPLLALRIRRR